MNCSPYCDIVDSNDAWIFLYLKITYNIGCGISSAKGFTSLNYGIFRFLTRFEKRVFKGFTYLASCVKLLAENNDLTKLLYYQQHLSQCNQYLLTNFIYMETLLNVDCKISKTKLRKLLNFCQKMFLVTIFEKNW